MRHEIVQGLERGALAVSLEVIGTDPERRYPCQLLPRAPVMAARRQQSSEPHVPGPTVESHSTHDFRYPVFLVELDPDLLVAEVLEFPGERLCVGIASGRVLVALGQIEGRRDHVGRPPSALELFQGRVPGLGIEDRGPQVVAAQIDATRPEHQLELVGDPIEQEARQLAVVFEVDLVLLVRHLVQGWLGNEQVPSLDELPHVAVKEGQQQDSNVRAVDIGVGHDDDPVVAQLEEDRTPPCRCRCRDTG